MKTLLSLSLRNYILNNKIPFIFIEFNEFYHSEQYDGKKDLPKDYQILILRKPELIAFEIEPFLNWPYLSDKVLLFHHSSSKEVVLIPLSFSHKLKEKDEDSQFNFSDYHSIKVCEGHILITTIGIGKELDNSHRCLDIALFTQKGKLVSAWKTENSNGYKTRVNNFHQLNPDHWIVNLKVNEGEKNKPSITRLYLLSIHNIKAYTLSTEKVWNSNIGLLLGTKTEKIKAWFSSEMMEDEPKFLVIASSYQCCIHRYEGEGRYVKLTDIVFDSNLFGNLEVTFERSKLNISSFTKKSKEIWNFELSY